MGARVGDPSEPDSLSFALWSYNTKINGEPEYVAGSDARSCRHHLHVRGRRRRRSIAVRRRYSSRQAVELRSRDIPERYRPCQGRPQSDRTTVPAALQHRLARPQRDVGRSTRKTMAQSGAFGGHARERRLTAGLSACVLAGQRFACFVHRGPSPRLVSARQR